MLQIKIIILFCTAAAVRASCPSIISRASWHAENPRRVTPAPIASYVVIHHSDTPECSTAETCAKRVKSIQHDHMHNKNPKWDDIGYNFLVGGDGNVFEGRGWKREGAHAPGFNSKSIGICIIGKYDHKLPNPAVLQAVKSLIKCGVDGAKIQSTYKLVGHRQVKKTTCPGTTLFDEIKQWPRWTEQP